MKSDEATVSGGATPEDRLLDVIDAALDAGVGDLIDRLVPETDTSDLDLSGLVESGVWTPVVDEAEVQPGRDGLFDALRAAETVVEARFRAYGRPTRCRAPRGSRMRARSRRAAGCSRRSGPRATRAGPDGEDGEPGEGPGAALTAGARR